MRLNDDRPVAVPIHVGMSIEEVEKLVIEATLQHTSGNITDAAKILGIDRSTLYQKIEKYKLRKSAD